MGNRMWAAAVAGLAALAMGAARADDQSVLELRLNSFMAGGYDPLTAPVDWYAPTETVDGAFAGDLATAAPGERTIATTALEAAAAYAETQDSLALIIVRGDKIELERYWQAAGRDTRFNPQSMSKTVIALLVGAAIADGAITSVDDPVNGYLERWSRDRRGRITLKDLLQMSAGLAQIT
ncbi:MAG: serine hydrolase domain-containing protein, partial [Pseudomonadota bacterium]